MASLAFAEFETECPRLVAHLKESGKGPGQVDILSPFPKVRRFFRAAGFNTIGTLDYFSNEDHKECSQFVFDALKRLESATSTVKDSKGNHVVYQNQISFYSQFNLCYKLFLIRILYNFLNKNKNYNELILFGPSTVESRTPFTTSQEKPLFDLSSEIQKHYSLNVTTIEAPIVEENEKFEKPLFPGLLRWMGKMALAKLSREKCLVLATHGASFFGMVRNHVLSHKNLPVIYLSGGDNYVMGRGPSGWKLTVMLVLSFLKLMIGKRFGEKYFGLDFDFITDLTLFENNEHHLQGVESIPSCLDYFRRELRFDQLLVGPKWVEKIEKAILPAAERMGRLAEGFDEICLEFKESSFLSPHSLNTSSLFGEITSRHKLNSLLITHGSHVPPQDDFLSEELRIHGRNLFTGPYPNIAVQSSLADKFLDYYKITAKKVFTGPILWGRKVEQSKTLRKKFNIPEDAKVLLHASTQKARITFRLFLFETPDEFLHSLLKLVEAVEKLENTYLIIKFRPKNYCSLEDLINTLPKSDRVIISQDEPFLDVLTVSDALISFSSTTIEEAIEYKKDVFLYGGRQRLSFIPTSEDREKRRKAVKLLREDNLLQDLEEGLKQMSQEEYPENERSQLIIQENQRTRLIDFIEGRNMSWRQ